MLGDRAAVLLEVLLEEVRQALPVGLLVIDDVGLFGVQLLEGDLGVVGALGDVVPDDAVVGDLARRAQ